jgi:hypothetical protein
MNWIIRHHKLFALCGLFGLVYFAIADVWWFGLIGFLGLLGVLAGRLPAPSQG